MIARYVHCTIDRYKNLEHGSVRLKVQRLESDSVDRCFLIWGALNRITREALQSLEYPTDTSQFPGALLLCDALEPRMTAEWPDRNWAFEVWNAHCAKASVAREVTR
ncbi:MAG TPA: hypothetical protein VJU58_06155 [Microbacterium sp.]|nr:hypothetical protein [Microbacterium sp.]